MSNEPVEQLLTDLSLTDPVRYELVQAVRQCIYSVAPHASECVKYGGFMFSGAEQFCGVFAYTEHVSLEFSRGCDLEDPYQVLEGKGKLRRHIKVHTTHDIDAKYLCEYLSRACC